MYICYKIVPTRQNEKCIVDHSGLTVNWHWLKITYDGVVVYWVFFVWSCLNSSALVNSYKNSLWLPWKIQFHNQCSIVRCWELHWCIFCETGLESKFKSRWWSLKSCFYSINQSFFIHPHRFSPWMHRNSKKLQKKNRYIVCGEYLLQFALIFYYINLSFRVSIIHNQKSLNTKKQVNYSIGNIMYTERNIYVYCA